MPGRVLIVDDDEAIRDIAEAVLSDEGYEVVTAQHGAAALAAVDRRPPDLILLDMRMPVMDGWEFAREYRRKCGAHAPIITVTAAQNAEQWAAEIGADGVLAKPFDLDDLLGVVQRHVRPPDRER